MKNAGIRVTHYKYDCGGDGDPLCKYPSKDCGGQTPGTWIYRGQIEKFYGKAEHRYYMLPDNTIATAPWGGPWPIMRIHHERGSKPTTDRSCGRRRVTRSMTAWSFASSAGFGLVGVIRGNVPSCRGR